MTAAHLGAEGGGGDLRDADELAEIELGDRAELWQVNWEPCMLYTSEHDRIRAAAGFCVASVASATSHQGHPFPGEWWPPSAGAMPGELTP